MENGTITVYDGMLYGEKVSEYGLKKGYLDYGTLSRIVGPCIFNGIVRDRTMSDWEIYAGEQDEEVMADFIISPNGAKFLKNYTEELVFYNEDLDLYIWAICHWGTNWDYVTTNLKLVEFEEGE